MYMILYVYTCMYITMREEAIVSKRVVCNKWECLGRIMAKGNVVIKISRNNLLKITTLKKEVLNYIKVENVTEINIILAITESQKLNQENIDLNQSFG